MKPLTRITILFGMMLMLFSLAFASPTSVSASDAEQSFAQPILVVNTSFLNVRTGPGAEYTVLVTVVGGTELPVLGVFRDGVWYQVNTDGGPGWVNVEFTLPRGDFTNLPLLDVGDTGAPNVNLGQGGGALGVTSFVGGQRIQGASLTGKDLHAQPDYESLIISRNVPNDPSTVYPLINATIGVDGTTWYQVNIPGAGVGWMDHVTLRALACGDDSVGIIVGETPINFDGIANRDPFLIPVGTEGFLGEFRGVNNEFVTFELIDGTVGFVSYAAVAVRTDVTNVCDGITSSTNLGQGGGVNASITTQGTQVTVPVLLANRVVINTSFLNIRSGPSAGFSVVATVSGGDELTVLGRATDNVWFLVEGGFGQGWLNSQFTLFRGDYSTVPVISEPVILGSANAGQGGGTVVPGANTIASGRQVTGVSLLGKDMHEGPSYDTLITSRSVPTDLSTVYPLLATQETDGTIWYLVDVENVGRGWMDAVELRLLECGNDSVGILLSTVPITFDGIANRAPFLLDAGIEFYITGRNGDQSIIELMDGTVGLVPANAVATRAGVTSVCTGVSTVASSQTNGITTNVPVPQVTGNRIVVNTGNLNVRSGPNAAFSVVATVPGSTELAVIGRATDGVWYFVEGSFGQGWVNSQFVVFRGDFGTVPVLDISG